MPGTGACAIPDAVAMTRHAVEAGADGVLMLPPFYYKTRATTGSLPISPRSSSASAIPA